MAKLKYDRPINITLNSSGRAMIPKGEVWKVFTNIYGDASGCLTNLYGGGIHSKLPPALRPYTSQASPSNTSKSKRIHGGDSPWLENLFSIERFGSRETNRRTSWYRKVNCGKLVSEAALEASRFTCPTRILTALTLGIGFLPEARRSKWEKYHYSTASLLRSWKNNEVEGVTLYA